MRRTIVLGLALAAVGCGGAPDKKPCDGLPTAHAKRRDFLVLFGAVDKFTARSLCAKFGAPQRVRPAERGEAWTYRGLGTFVLREGRVRRLCLERDSQRPCR
jgi:hypothetical protein